MEFVMTTLEKYIIGNRHDMKNDEMHKLWGLVKKTDVCANCNKLIDSSDSIDAEEWFEELYFYAVMIAMNRF